MFYRTLGISLAACLLPATSALGANSYERSNGFQNSPPAAGFAREYGETLPPIGWVQFCSRFKRDCAGAGRRVPAMQLTAQKWNELQQVNTYVNQKIAPVTDENNYGVAEYWTYPNTNGDCEDYALLKRRYLISMGWPREALLITVVLNPDKSGHAVLTAVTDRGEFMLDNQSRQVLPQRATPYTYIKRQSQVHPQIWVSINRNYRKKVRSMASRN